MNTSKVKWFASIIVMIIIVGITTRGISVTSKASLQVGDYVIFASYNNEAILWRVINIDEEGAPLLYAEHILSLKAFDAAGDYHEDTFRHREGSNHWKNSNIRQWLNSTHEIIEWRQNPPTAENLWEGHNPYHLEKGFLAEGNFTEAERNRIKPIIHKALLSEADKNKKDGGDAPHVYFLYVEGSSRNYDTAYYQNVTDYVFFLSIKEMEEFIHNRGWNVRAKPTKMAVENSTYSHRNLRENMYWHNWLRTPYTDYPSRTRHTYNHGFHNESMAFGSVVGVRPALYLDISSKIEFIGDGSLENPYIIKVD